MRSAISAHIWLTALAFATAVVVSQPAAADDRQACLKGSKETAVVAIDACTRAIQSGEYQAQDLSALYHARGTFWSWTSLDDRVDRALKDYTDAIRFDPKAVGSLLNRSHIYNQRHDYDRAIADANGAFEGGPSEYGKRVGYNERGYAYQAKGDNDRAIADFTESIRLDGNNTGVLTTRGNAYLTKGDPDHAIADYDRVIVLDSRNAVAYYNRSLAYRAKGDFDRVIADSSQAIALYPNYRDAYFNRGYAYQIKGNLDRAIADYDRMIALDPKDKDAYSSRSAAYLLKGDLRKAIADLGWDQALPCLVIIVLLAAVTWLCWRVDLHARGRWSKGSMIEIIEREITDLKGRNAVLERIAVALEKH